MATIINVTNNTFNKTRQAKYALVKEIVDSMIYRTYPNGCSGYEEFGPASKLLDIIETNYVSGNGVTSASMTLDPSLLSKEDFDTLIKAKEFALKWNIRLYTLVNVFLSGTIHKVTEDEMNCIKDISKQLNFKYTDINLLFNLELSKINGKPEPMYNVKAQEVIDNWFNSL